MLTKEILAIKAGTETTIINVWNGNTRRRSETTLQDIEPNRSVTVTLVNHKRYIPSPNTSEEQSYFQEDGSGKGGFLVSWSGNGTTRYAVVKPVNFVATSEAYNEYWSPILAQRKIDAEKREAERLVYEERRAKRNEVEISRKNAIQSEAERIGESVSASLAALLGARANQHTRIRLEVSGEWQNEDTDYEEYRVSQYGTVTLELRDALRLIELALAE